MKKLFYVFVVILLSCQPKQKEAVNMISVSILPQKYFVNQIAGKLIQVNVLVPPGASIHSYEVLPSQMKDLAMSKAWLQIGLLTFEQAWKTKFADINKNLVIVNCSEGITPIAGSEHNEEGHQHAANEAFDPHIWLAPEEVKIIAKNTLNALETGFPQHSSTFKTNYARFIVHIDSISQEINQKLSLLKNRNILIFHPALAYYARQFRLSQMALEFNGKEPSPRHMKEIVDLAHEQNIHVIFIQKEFDPSFAQQLSHEIDGKVVIIDPLEYNWEKQIMDITDKIAAE